MSLEGQTPLSPFSEISMARLVLQGFLLLLYFELILKFEPSTRLHDIVRERRANPKMTLSTLDTERLCRAVDFACVFYFKQVRCLQRAAATTILLRRYGRAVEMVTGARVLPLESHAWVEFQGKVVNDKPYMRELYQVLDCC
jgi:Transglutaminase-like superfamily